LTYPSNAKSDSLHHVPLSQPCVLGIRPAFITYFHPKSILYIQASCIQASWKPVLSGIPQGSVLGPLLFLLFVSDVPHLVQNLISMFADDTKLFAILVNNTQSASSLREDLKNLQDWSAKMQMRFHPDKCHILHLGPKKPMEHYTMISANGESHVLKSVEHEKDLGVTMDRPLKFSTHVDTIVKKANRTLGCISHTFKYLNKDSFLLLYKSLIRPILEYASCVWSPQLKRDRDALEKVQRRATRLVPEFKGLSYPERLEALKLPTLKFRRLRADLIQTFKLVHNIDHMSQNTRCSRCPNKMMFQPSLSQHTRGHSLKLQIQEASGARKHFFSTRAIPEWNKLSESTITSSTVNNFKSGLKDDLKHHPDQYHYVFSY
jgi:ribonuclease P/MRP protein subunit RPP40